MKKLLSVIICICVCFSLSTAFVGCSPKEDSQPCTHEDSLIKTSTTATCLKAGTETWKCIKCFEEITKYVQAYGHIFNCPIKDNRLCNYCKLPQFNVAFSNMPATITAYKEINGLTVKFSEVSVNKYSLKYYFNSSSKKLMISFSANVTYLHDPTSYDRTAVAYARIMDKDGNDTFPGTIGSNSFDDHAKAIRPNVGDEVFFYFMCMSNPKNNVTYYFSCEFPEQCNF